jgi:hypothetical protein
MLRVGGMSQVVELLSTKCEALSSSPTTAKKERYIEIIVPSTCEYDMTTSFLKISSQKDSHK